MRIKWRDGHIACRWLSVLLLMLTVTGCRDDRAMLAQLETGPVVKAARAQLETLRQRHADYLFSEFKPALQTPAVKSQVQKLADQFPAGEPNRITLIGYQGEPKAGVTRRGPELTVADCDFSIAFMYSYPANWVEASIKFHVDNDQIVLDDLSVQPLSAPLEGNPLDSLKYISGPGICAILLAILNIVLTVGTLATTWRKPLPKRRWVWRFLMLWGIGCWTMNCQESLWTWNTFFVAIPAVSYDFDMYQPLVLKLYLPVFAIAYWLRFASRRRREEAREMSNIVDTFS